MLLWVCRLVQVNRCVQCMLKDVLHVAGCVLVHEQQLLPAPLTCLPAAAASCRELAAPAGDQGQGGRDPPAAGGCSAGQC